MFDVLLPSFTWLHFLVFLTVIIGSVGTPTVLVLSVNIAVISQKQDLVNGVTQREKRRGTAGAGSGERTDVGFYGSGCCNSLSGWCAGAIWC